MTSLAYVEIVSGNLLVVEVPPLLGPPLSSPQPVRLACEMAPSKWSVRLVLGEGEAGPISRGFMAVAGPEIHQASIGRDPNQEEDEPDTITFEIDGVDANDARVRCQHKLGELQRHAGLPVRQAPVVWVARLSDEPTSSLRFLSEAKTLVGDEQFEMAVVAAQIHLEVQVRVLVEALATSQPPSVLSAVIAGQHRWAPHERWLHPILDALFGVKMTDSPAWSEYNAHVSRRNSIVHRGQAIDAASAKASLNAVSELWLWLNQAASAIPRAASE
jgi:hypothetical protein